MLKSLPLCVQRRPFYRAIALGLILAVFFFHLGFAPSFDLVPDEAYYWLWSKHPAFSYATKGPLVAWAIAIGSFFFGDSVLGVRIMSVVFGLGSGLFLYLLAEELFGAFPALLAVIFAAGCPLFSIGSVLMTIDSPSLFFWLLSAFLFLKALSEDKLRYWIWAGISVGLGFLAKYVNGLEILSFSLYLALQPQRRSLLCSNRFFSFLSSALLVSLPVWIWNFNHGWVTVFHLLHRGGLTSSLGFHPSELLKFFQEQLLSYSPFLFVGILWAVLLALFIPSLRSPQALYCLTLFSPVFLFYFFLSFQQAAKGNWTVTAISSGIILLAYVCSKFWALPTLKLFVLGGLLLSFLQTALLHGESLSFLGVKPGKDPLLRPRGWQSVAIQLKEIQDHFHPDFFIASDYGLAAALNFLLQNCRFYLPTDLRSQTQYAYWESYSVKPHCRAIYISNDGNAFLPQCLKKEFGQIEPIGGFWREYKGKKIEYYRLWLLLGSPATASEK
ncbi:glycosyltransferase family 39 protein [Candidatus Methylacidiphilum infernorum]|uniref:Glycosyltransferase family 39 protein n=1 Tax=Candidatus Methylacidiphilum infernorum TaxID=511746 RepID=A0ABX7PYE4_9BACT|nr:glycosyltransferase family 39 protein [Candidatus Methylacidiphilum infernorum]QSR87668.1 glycosyltransferase family 39 protein [Candidatus Methylacidiphilum infernorum]